MKWNKHIHGLLIFVLMMIQTGELFAKNRFPKPEFESGYVQPETVTLFSRDTVMEYIDVAVLLASLSLVTWFVLKKRSRKGVFWMAVFSILYFGFYRKGCICAVGSIQNVTLTFFTSNYSIPLTALLFFILPLIFTLLFGRTFCAGVCPLGAIQDIVGLRPMPVKAWVEKTLGIVPFLYLGLAVLYAATGTDFIICRYDPIVGFYRLDAGFSMFVIGAILLLTGIFIARPYCRYLCPYGAILNIVSRVSFKHMSISPSNCINCRLCENSCPYGSINKPSSLKEKETSDVIVRRYIIFSVLIPVLVFAGGFLASNFYKNLAMVNKKVRLAYEIQNNTNYGVEGKEALEITGFRSSGEPVGKLNAEASSIMHEFYKGSWIFGGFTGLVFGLTLLGLTVFKYHTDYSPDKATCHSCGRCMEHCPVKMTKKNG